MPRLRMWMGWGVGVILLAGAVITTPGFAEEERTIQGEVIDPAAYLKDGQHGPELATQTYEALDGGQTLAVLEDGTSVLYLLIAEAPGEDPNELVYDYVNQRMTLTGRIYERGGLQGIVLTSAQPITPAEPAQAAAP